jgi:crotonobetainyl-CoA:carnitine CoA-transferase CaiB-like acyl-CoA transferase
VLDTKELMEDANFQARGILQKVEHPVVGDYSMPGWPVRHDGAPPVISSSPLLGEHSREVLRSWIGLSQRDLERLLAEKVVAG